MKIERSKKVRKSKRTIKGSKLYTISEIIKNFSKNFFKLLFLFFMGSSIVIVTYFYIIIPPFKNLLDSRVTGSVTLLDRNGRTFAWRGNQLDSSLRSNNVSKDLINAIIAVEDKNFFSHLGISFSGILGAMRTNIVEGRHPFKGHGGSTITQQVAKLLCMMQKNKSEKDCRRQSIKRKILEIPFAFALELKFSKSEILSIYMNRVYLGANSTGFESATQRYFGKSTSQVSLQEAAMLAALLTAPSRYTPINNLKLAQERSKLVIQLMLKQKLITLEQAKEALHNPARLTKRARASHGAHFADWVMSEAPNLLTSRTTEDIVIRTTFDPLVQKHIEETVTQVFQERVRENSKSEIAVVIMSRNGEVLGMLGGRNNTTLPGQYNRAFQAFRQPGSAFKPFIYAAALNAGYLPKMLLVDTPDPPKGMKKNNYWPKNYDNNYRGKVDMTTALSKSVNTASVHLAKMVGVQEVKRLAYDLGIKSTMPNNLSIALGTGEVSLLNLTNAYNGFLNLGKPTYPKGWSELRLRDTNEVLISSFGQKYTSVLDKVYAKAIIQMLMEAVENGTGKEARISDWQIAGKTGTTQNARDAWFVGFTSSYVGGVWIGKDDNSPLTGVIGGNLPTIVWARIMEKIHKKTPNNLPSLSQKNNNLLFSNSKVNKMQTDPTVQEKFWNRIFKLLTQETN